MTLIAAGAALCAFLGSFALSASPASAFLFKLKNGHYLSYMAIAGKGPIPTAGPGGSSSASSASTSSTALSASAKPFDTKFSNLDYSGGPVMTSNKNYIIEWLPSTGYSGVGFQANYVTGIQTFLQDVAHDSGMDTNNDSITEQYNQAGGPPNTAAYSSTYGGMMVDTDSYRTTDCEVHSGQICFVDADIQTELATYLAAHPSLPTGLGTEYFVLTPPDVVTCFDSTSGECSANDTIVRHEAFCAYHNEAGDISMPSKVELYANIPDMTTINGCDPYFTYCNVAPDDSCPTEPDPAAGVLSALDHEHLESVTDPEPNNAWTDWQPNCSSSVETCGGEIGDKCYTDLQTDPTTGEPVTETINGNDYWLQTMWSNVGASCKTTLTLPYTSPVTAAGVSSSTNSANDIENVTTTGTTGSIADYVWQPNDFPNGTPDFPQDFTVETTTPTTALQFAAPGTWCVALTVMSSTGASYGTDSKQSPDCGVPPNVNVTVLESPAASFTSSAPPLYAPTTVSFSGTSTNPNGGALAYGWTFGDGATSSSQSPTHTYAAPGKYTVTLTVTDTHGKAGSVSHTVTVLDALPTASFSAPSNGLAGQSVAFLGSAADSDGSITSTSWNFGDGSGASGTSVSHTYGAAGTYAVTFTATDATGQSASVVHNVTVSGTCKVPSVKGKSRSKASRVARSAGCTLGKVKTPKKKQRKALVVKRQSPAAGAIVAAGTAIALVLGYK
jgi:PKD repeat protein